MLVFIVGEEVEIMDGGKAVTGIDNLLQRPAGGLVAPGFFGILRRDDLRICRDCLVPLEVEVQEDRGLGLDMIRQVH